MDARSPQPWSEAEETRTPQNSGVSWKSALLVTKQGEPKAILANAALALRSAPEWQGVLAYDQFALRTVVLRAPPWTLIQSGWAERCWTPDDDLKTTEWLQCHNICVGLEIAQQAIETVAHDFSFHPVRNYLSDLKWDGRPRLDRIFADYFGAELDLYSETASRISLIAAVARIMEPGCKVDTVPILEGEQGTMKSTAIKTLFDPWFSDELGELGSKDAAMQTAGVWCIELAELDSLSRAENSRVKAFLSRRTDRFRPPYGRRVIEADRQCVFWGSTNNDNYLSDETGSRRFLPIRTGRINVTNLERDRDQIFAEAIRQYNDGVAWWIVSKTADRIAKDEQHHRLHDDPWKRNVAEYLDSSREDRVTVHHILTNLGVPLDRQTQAHLKRVAGILKSMGWDRRQVRIEGGEREWLYQKQGANR